VEPGWKEGTKIKFKFESPPVVEGGSGSGGGGSSVVEFEVVVEEDEVYSRKGDDIRVEHIIR